jgi:hypothetical protein
VTTRNYWLDLFTWETWQEFLAAGAETSGFRESRWKTVQQMKPGDYLLCYMTGISRWIGMLEVTSSGFRDETAIWKGAVFPCRVRVKVVVKLTPETAVPIHLLKEQLSMFQNMASPASWTGMFRGSPNKMKPSDGDVIVSALLEAARNPVERSFDPAKLNYVPRTFQTGHGEEVTIPEDEESPHHASRDTSGEVETKETTTHEEVQSLLLKLGADMGFYTWVARNDRSREVKGQKLADLPRVKRDLPLQFDEATNKTVELIDVLWLKGNAIVAAFEIESTTSIYSGLLRMSDLIAMQPNLNIPLYLVAPDERREKVVTEVNRPTFSRLSPPLNAMCRFIPFSLLRQRLSQVGSLARYLKPDFLDELSESCQIERG